MMIIAQNFIRFIQSIKPKKHIKSSKYRAQYVTVMDLTYS
jgi:hypothetical protein